MLEKVLLNRESEDKYLKLKLFTFVIPFANGTPDPHRISED
jgi:hypothetical protein